METAERYPEAPGYIWLLKDSLKEAEDTPSLVTRQGPASMPVLHQNRCVQLMP